MAVLDTRKCILRRFDDLDVSRRRDNTQLVLFQTQITSLLVDLTYLQRSQYANSEVDNELLKVEQQLRDRVFEIEIQLKNMQFKPVIEESTPVANEDIDINVLRKRLLTSETNQFDSIDSENTNHDNIQSELIESLPALVSAIKDQALQFQEMIQNDANILKDVTNKFEMSQGKFTNVNDALNKYHKEGKLGIWFYIRVIGTIFFSFLTLLILIRLIPAR